MTIVAYASGAQNLPNENPPASYTETHDPVLELANTNLPVDVNLYGNAVDSNDANAVFTYSWSILSQTHQNPGLTLSGNGAVQNPTLEQVNTWGNIRCFLVVTNNNSGETSQTDPLRAPDSAFVTVRLKSPSATIQKIASGERNWHNDADDWVQAIEDIAAGNQGLPPHTITDHTDVVDATGADLEVLTGGGYANDPDAVAPNPNGALHIHHGDQVDVATRNTRGTIALEDGNGPARAINVETIVLTASIVWTRLDNGQVVPLIAPLTLEDDAVPFSGNLATWNVGEKVNIKRFSIALADGGTAQPGDFGGQYVFDLTIGTDAQFIADNLQRTNIDLTGAPAIDHQPLFLASAANIVVPAGNVIGLVCAEGPSKVSEALGANLTATVVLAREAL